jgi:hypothetical protein
MLSIRTLRTRRFSDSSMAVGLGRNVGAVRRRACLLGACRGFGCGLAVRGGAGHWHSVRLRRSARPAPGHSGEQRIALLDCIHRCEPGRRRYPILEPADLAESRLIRRRGAVAVGTRSVSLREGRSDQRPAARRRAQSPWGIGAPLSLFALGESASRSADPKPRSDATYPRYPPLLPRQALPQPSVEKRKAVTEERGERGPALRWLR